MKKTVALLLALCMILVLCACGAAETTAPAVKVPIPKLSEADTTDAHTKTLTICFYLPSDVDEGAQMMDLSFDFSVRAVQSRNQNADDKIYFGDETETSEPSKTADPSETATNQ